MIPIIGCSLGFFDELRILSLRSSLQDLEEFSFIISLNKLFAPFSLLMLSRVTVTHGTILNNKVQFQMVTQELPAVILTELSTEKKKKQTKQSSASFSLEEI